MNRLNVVRTTCILLMFLLSSGLAYSDSDKQNLTLVYTGNLDGELEPCGCSEGGDKGGLKRRAQALDDLRKDNPGLYLFSTGGLLTSEITQDKLKSQYILSGMSALNYDAIGVQWKDLSYGADLLTTSKLPFVVSNSKQAIFTQKIDLHRAIGKHSQLAFFSWLDPNRNPQKNAQDSIAENSTHTLAEALATAKANNQLTLLSTTLPLKSAQQKLPLENVDILFIKSKYEHYGEPKKIGDLLVLQPGSRGMRIGKLTLITNNAGKIKNWEHQVIALPSDVPDAPRMKNWYANYNAEVKADYDKHVAMKKELATRESPFAGEATCKNCHMKEHEIWSGTRHAEAFYALQDANKAFDPSCIQCHTVGFEMAGGFIEPTITENLMHVQCENCHGAANAHVKSAGKLPPTNNNWNPTKICSQCHIQNHSPDFSFETYWPKISHGHRN